MMKKVLIASLSLVLLLSLWVLAFAGIPPSLGLPTVNISGTNNQKWAPSVALTSTGNGGSAMCVDCHTRNPGTHAPPSVFPGGSQNLSFVGSHFVTNTFADTNTGGGYAGAVSGIRATGDQYIKRDATAWPAGRYSKYGRVSGTTLLSDNTMGALSGRQLICESCHNITRNFGKYKLLALIDNAYVAGDSALCSGCHGDMQQGINNEPSFFDNTANPGNHHHRNYQTATIYGGTGSATFSGHDMKVIKTGAGYYGPPSKLWAASYGQLTGNANTSTGRNAAYNTANNPGIKNAPIDNGMIHVDNSASLYCLSCHRAHNAVSSTAGLVLKTSDNNVYTWGGSAIPNNASPTAGNTWQALRRQSDFGDPSNYTNRLIKDDRPLCNGCHQLR